MKCMTMMRYVNNDTEDSRFALYSIPKLNHAQ